MTKSERARYNEIQSRLQNDVSLSEQGRGQLRHELENLRNASTDRKQTKQSRRVEKHPPKREDFANESEWQTACELHRLDLMEKSAHKTLSRQKSLPAMLTADRTLRKVQKRREELLAEQESNREPIPNETKSESVSDSEPLTPKPKSEKYVMDLLNERNVWAALDGEDAASTKRAEAELENLGVEWEFWCLAAKRHGTGVQHLFPDRKAAERLIESVRLGRGTNA